MNKNEPCRLLNPDGPRTVTYNMRCKLPATQDHFMYLCFTFKFIFDLHFRLCITIYAIISRMIRFTTAVITTISFLKISLFFFHLRGKYFYLDKIYSWKDSFDPAFFHRWLHVILLFSDKDLCKFGQMTMHTDDVLNRIPYGNNSCIVCLCDVPPVPTCVLYEDKSCYEIKNCSTRKIVYGRCY